MAILRSDHSLDVSSLPEAHLKLPVEGAEADQTRFWETTVGKVGNTVFQLFLKNDSSHAWSLYDINNIPTAINGKPRTLSRHNMNFQQLTPADRFQHCNGDAGQHLGRCYRLPPRGGAIQSHLATLRYGLPCRLAHPNRTPLRSVSLRRVRRTVVAAIHGLGKHPL